MTSGFHARICSRETVVSEPDPAAAATFRRADELQDLQVDGTGQTGLETGWPAAVIDERLPVGWNSCNALRHITQGGFGVARKVLGPRFLLRDRTELAKGFGRFRESAVDENVGNSGLPLDAFGQGRVGRIHAAEIQDEIGLGG